MNNVSLEGTILAGKNMDLSRQPELNGIKSGHNTVPATRFIHHFESVYNSPIVPGCISQGAQPDVVNNAEHSRQQVLVSKRVPIPAPRFSLISIPPPGRMLTPIPAPRSHNKGCVP